MKTRILPWVDKRSAPPYPRLDSLIVGLGLLGMRLAYIAYYYIFVELGALTASGVTYIPPVVALAIGAIVGDAICPVGYLAMP